MATTTLANVQRVVEIEHSIRFMLHIRKNGNFKLMHCHITTTLSTF